MSGCAIANSAYWRCRRTRRSGRRFPDEVARRQLVGEFFYRPSGGESFADVALRLRSLLRDVGDDLAGKRVLIMCHDAVVLLLRYLIEGIEHSDVLALGPVFNASVTRWAGDTATARLVEFNAVNHLSNR